MKLQLKIGDATHPQENSPWWLLQGNNNFGAWGAGFVIAVNKAFGVEDGSPIKEYFRWFEVPLNEGNFPPTLGDIQLVKVIGGNRVVNMITQKDCGGVYCEKEMITIPFRYEAFEECLLRVRHFALKMKEKSGKLPNLIAPRIGCGLAGADFGKTQDIIKKVFKDTNIIYTIYDLPPKDTKNERV